MEKVLLINKNQLNNYDGFIRTSLITNQFYARLIKKLTSTLKNISINTIQPSKINRSNLLKLSQYFKSNYQILVLIKNGLV
jgi:hypothetical protein